ncbi:MAG: type IV pilin [Candidatus Nanosalina sp.]
MGLRKGITPVVAVVLLISVTVAGAGVVYQMVVSTQEQAQNPADRLNINPSSLEFESCWGTSSDANFSIRNTGQSAINASEVPVRVNRTYLDQTAGDYSVHPPIVDPQQTFTLDINKPISSESRVALVLEGKSIRYQCRNLN